ncbi:MAG: hypothetical protein BGO14_07805 [Chlamydiales bacterium 38-26]|nr:hypothetical protein [Chlamydiales bacterium]OJV10902.1 MAG: hypothetical protein BGO14_07805 [Chlamydiales bacterium 38-26]
MSAAIPHINNPAESRLENYIKYLESQPKTSRYTVLVFQSDTTKKLQVVFFSLKDKIWIVDPKEETQWREIGLPHDQLNVILADDNVVKFRKFCTEYFTNLGTADGPCGYTQIFYRADRLIKILQDQAKEQAQ